MEKSVVISFVIAVIGVVALGVTSWLSIKNLAALRDQERASFDRYKGVAGDHAAELERQVALGMERGSQMEKTLVQAEQRATEAQRHAIAFENEVRETRVRTDNALAIQAKKHADELDKAAAEIKMRTEQAEIARHALELLHGLADPQRRAQKAPEINSPSPEAERPATETTMRAARGTDEPSAARFDLRVDRSAIVSILARLSGAKAAIYALDEAPDAANLGSSINAMLAEAGWSSALWKWSGVSGIVGVVVLTKEGDDPTTDRAASRLVDTFRLAGLNIVKANWPADWRRHRGTLTGPETPAPTDAPIRIVIGAKSRD